MSPISETAQHGVAASSSAAGWQYGKECGARGIAELVVFRGRTPGPVLDGPLVGFQKRSQGALGWSGVRTDLGQQLHRLDDRSVGTAPLRERRDRPYEDGDDLVGF